MPRDGSGASDNVVEAGENQVHGASGNDVSVPESFQAVSDDRASEANDSVGTRFIRRRQVVQSRAAPNS